MKLTLGISPCPNDTFIFDALIHKKTKTGDIEIDLLLEDVETLNRLALEGRLDIVKVSYGVLPLLLPQYQLLQAGGALGNGVGPLLISKQAITTGEIAYKKIALPGMHTTAHLLFSLAYPDAAEKIFMRFNEIENAVLSGIADAGVIIHENRFTYQQKGLIKITDLSEYWEKKTGLPIPLGGIVANKKLDAGIIKKVDDCIRQSVEFAFSNYPALPSFVYEHAQEMDEAVMQQHIELYVNKFSLGLGKEGEKAVGMLLEIYNNLHKKNEV